MNKFETPKLEIQKIDVEDVIATSNIELEDTETPPF